MLIIEIGMSVIIFVRKTVSMMTTAYNKETTVVIVGNYSCRVLQSCKKLSSTLDTGKLLQLMTNNSTAKIFYRDKGDDKDVDKSDDKDGDKGEDKDDGKYEGKRQQWSLWQQG